MSDGFLSLNNNKFSNFVIVNSWKEHGTRTGKARERHTTNQQTWDKKLQEQRVPTDHLRG